MLWTVLTSSPVRVDLLYLNLSGQICFSPWLQTRVQSTSTGSSLRPNVITSKKIIRNTYIHEHVLSLDSLTISTLKLISTIPVTFVTLSVLSSGRPGSPGKLPDPLRWIHRKESLGPVPLPRTSTE